MGCLSLYASMKQQPHTSPCSFWISVWPKTSDLLTARHGFPSRSKVEIILLSLIPVFSLRKCCLSRLFSEVEIPSHLLLPCLHPWILGLGGCDDHCEDHGKGLLLTVSQPSETWWSWSQLVHIRDDNCTESCWGWTVPWAKRNPWWRHVGSGRWWCRTVLPAAGSKGMVGDSCYSWWFLESLVISTTSWWIIATAWVPWD